MGLYMCTVKQIKKEATVKYEKAISAGDMEDAKKFGIQLKALSMNGNQINC